MSLGVETAVIFGGTVARVRKQAWKKARGKLGVLEPLIGSWKARAESPMGPVECRRTFSRVLGKAYVLLQAEWNLGAGKRYTELSVFGPGDGGGIAFWSFTSDGKRSQGHLTDGTDVHPEAIAFEAQVPAGMARMIYWPGDDGGFNWAVEARTKKGWTRFTEHRYHPFAAAPGPGTLIGA